MSFREAPFLCAAQLLTGLARSPKDHGSCHCGAVTLAVKVKPLETWDISKEEERIVECNCSICVRVSTPIQTQPPSTRKGSFI